MKIRELICERISVSQDTSTIHSLVMDSIRSVIAIKSTPPKSITDMGFLIKYTNLLTNAINPQLVKFAKKRYNIDINIKFSKLNKGTGTFQEETNTIIISSVVLGNIIRVIFKLLNGETGFENDISENVDKITMIFLHELTHAIQVNHGQRYEYKHGYVEKDKVKFFTALVQDAFDTPAEEKRAKEIYKSQPDEISAYGQQKAVELINKIHNLPKNDQTTAINIFLNNIGTGKINHDYNDFVNRTEPGYEKSYRRYLKVVYQELDSYRDSIKELA